MSVRLSLPAPAKLNLFLHILGRRDDGYHELQTLFQFLDHGDELHFEARQDGQVRLHTEIAGVPHDSNLIVRAARGLQEASGSPQGVDIWLDKRLPMGGGIGGSPADARLSPRAWAKSSPRWTSRSPGISSWFRKYLSAQQKFFQIHC